MTRLQFGGFLDTAAIDRSSATALDPAHILGAPGELRELLEPLEPVRSLSSAEVGLYLHWGGKLSAGVWAWREAVWMLGAEVALAGAEWVGPARDLDYGKIVRAGALDLRTDAEHDDAGYDAIEAEEASATLTGAARVLFPVAEVVGEATFRTTVGAAMGILDSPYPSERRAGARVLLRFPR